MKKPGFNNPILVLPILLIVHLVVLFVSETAHGGADMIGHYFISHYAFKYPYLLFDHWGKPFYTLLASPFALMGFVSARLFSILCGLFSVYFIMRILNGLGARLHWLAYLGFAFAPMFFHVMQSTLTETLLGLMLVVVVFLVMKEKYMLSAFIISFMPFVRTEAVIFFPIIASVYIYRKQYLAIPWLLAGAIIYTVAGYFFHHDWFWIINKMPYSIGSSIYGKGELLHFVRNHNLITGWPISVLLLTGTILWTWEILKTGFRPDTKTQLLLLITFLWISYFAAHSIVWWKGMGGSLGLIRVMAAIVPLMAIPALYGLHHLFARFIKNQPLQITILLAIVVFQAYNYRKHLLYEYSYSTRTELTLEVAGYLENINKTKIYFFDPYIPFFMGIDPYDPKIARQGAGERFQPSGAMAEGEILVWDAHFGPNEQQLPLSYLENDSDLVREASFYPAVPLKVLGGYNYEIHIYRKKTDSLNQTRQCTLSKRYDFENFENLQTTEWDQKSCIVLNTKTEFSPNIRIDLQNLKHNDSTRVSLQVMAIADEEIRAAEVLLVATIEEDSRILFYQTSPMVVSPGETNKWKLHIHSVLINKSLSKNAKGKFYIWNKERKTLGIEWMEAKIEVAGHCE
jgi:hypothetical protein